MIEEKHPSRIQVIYFATLLIVAFVLTYFIFRPFLSVFVIALALSVILDPVYKWILNKVNYKFLASLITVILVVLVLLIPLFFLGRQIFFEARNTFESISSGQTENYFAISYLQDKLHVLFPTLNIDVRTYIIKLSNSFIGNLGAFFSGTIDLALKTLLIIIALFYLLKDGARFRATFVKFSPLPDKYDEKIMDTLERSIRSIARGSFLVAMIQGILSGIGYTIFGLPNPALWGLVTAVSALVPGFGTSLVLVPSILYLFFTAPLSHSIGLLLWGALLVGLIDNFLSPKIIEKGGVNIHPLFILFSVIGGVAYFGPGGFILGPLVLSFLLTLLEIYDLFSQTDTKRENL